MRIIAFMNQKGGVGKTTTTANVGAALAELGKRVCLVDLDPQAHLSINYGVDPSPDVPSLYNILVDGDSFKDAARQVGERVMLIPSSIDLAAAEIELVGVAGRETLLKKRLEEAALDYDFMLLDCPPSLGLLTLNALAMAGEVIIPMQPHFLALQGVAKLLETVHLVSRRMNPKLKVAGIVLTMFDAQTKLSSEVVNELNGFIMDAMGKPLPWATARVFDTRIRRNIKLAESPSFGKTIIDYDPASNGASDYRSLARELLGVKDVPASASGRAQAPEEVGTRTEKKTTASVAASMAEPVKQPLASSQAVPAAKPQPTAAPSTKGSTPVTPRAASSTRPPGPPPQRTGPIRPVPPVKVTVNPDLDAKKLAAAGAGTEVKNEGTATTPQEVSA